MLQSWLEEKLSPRRVLFQPESPGACRHRDPGRNKLLLFQKGKWGPFAKGAIEDSSRSVNPRHSCSRLEENQSRSCLDTPSPSEAKACPQSSQNHPKVTPAFP